MDNKSNKTHSTYHFNVALAEEFGLEEAIIYQNIKFWCEKNRANEQHFHDGYFWTYNSTAAFSSLFPFWKPSKIRTILLHMIDLKMIKTGRYNKIATDRTLWYTDILEETIKENAIYDSSEYKENTSSIRKNVKLQVDDFNNEYYIPDIKHTDIKHTINKLIVGENLDSPDSDFFKFIPMIQKTAILKGGFNTRTKKKTKTVLSVINYLKQIRNGSFLKIGLNKVWIEEQNINTSRIIGITTDEKLEKLLAKAFTRFNKMKTDANYWPADKKNLQKMTLPSFFFNPMSGKSWFLKCLSSQPELLKQNLADTKLEQVKKSLEKIEPNMEKLIGKIYNSNIIRKWDSEDQLAFYSTVRDLVNWRLKNKDVLKSLSEGWGSHFGSTSKFLGTVANFVNISCPKPFPRFLQVEGYNWREFAHWCSDYIGVKITIPKKKKESK